MKTYKKALKEKKKLNIGDFITFPQNIFGRDVVKMFAAKGIDLEVAYYTDENVKSVLETRKRVPFGIFKVVNIKN